MQDLLTLSWKALEHNSAVCKIYLSLCSERLWSLDNMIILPRTYATVPLWMSLYFLLLRVMANDMKAKVMPTMHTPNQLARFHKYPAQNVPSEPPIKYVVMKMVLARLEACGISCRHPLWLLSCWHCNPMSTRMMAAMSHLPPQHPWCRRVRASLPCRFLPWKVAGQDERRGTTIWPSCCRNQRRHGWSRCVPRGGEW